MPCSNFRYSQVCSKKNQNAGCFCRKQGFRSVKALWIGSAVFYVLQLGLIGSAVVCDISILHGFSLEIFFCEMDNGITVSVMCVVLIVLWFSLVDF